MNKLDISVQEEMDDVELTLLEQLTETILDEVEEAQTLTVEDLINCHRRWLGNVY